jgi:hypothetical protein
VILDTGEPFIAIEREISMHRERKGDGCADYDCK